MAKAEGQEAASLVQISDEEGDSTSNKEVLDLVVGGMVLDLVVRDMGCNAPVFQLLAKTEDATYNL